MRARKIADSGFVKADSQFFAKMQEAAAQIAKPPGGARLGRLVVRALMWVMMVAAGLWAADWMVWQGRAIGGGAYGSVSVDRFVVAPLKNNKEEYYPDGRVEVRCTRSLLPEGLPQAGARPCWWVERNPVVFDR